MTLQLNEKIAASDEEKQQAIDNMDKLTETLDRLQSQLDEVSQQLEKACEEILKKDQLVLDLQEQHEVFKQAGQVVVDDKTRLESMVEHLEQELVSWKQELTEFLSRRTEAYCSWFRPSDLSDPHQFMTALDQILTSQDAEMTEMGDRLKKLKDLWIWLI